jgi:hypothetical protein
MHATLTPAAGGEGDVSVSVAIPASAGMCGEMVVSSVTVTGQPVTGGQLLPARLQVIRAMYTPQQINAVVIATMITPAIAHGGTLYAPQYGSRSVVVVAADGTLLPSLPIEALGLSDTTHCAAFIDATGTLLLADEDFPSKLVAVDAASRAVRWSAALGHSCYGMAALPVQGVVVVSDSDNRKLHVHRLSDGVRVASAKAVCATYIAADPASGTVFASTVPDDDFVVSIFRWDGAALVVNGVVEAAGTADNDRPLAVMPPTSGRHTAYLVVGTCDVPTLRVLSLPDRRLVHTHTLEGMEVQGLAADPSGTALAVCDAASAAIHVLPWPLPGMPPLQ